MKKILVLVAAALTALLPTSCRKSESEPAKPLPASVSIAEVAPAKRAVSFTLNPTNAVRVLYCCVLRGETPAESAWIAREAAAPVQLTVGELEAGTAYTLLARADVGVAMGSGSDIAMDAARVTILNSDPGKIPEMIRCARLTVRTIRQNLFWAFIYNAVGIPIAAGALYPLWGFRLDPMIAGAAMAMSSVSVVANSLRLKRRRLSPKPQKSMHMEKKYRVEGMMCDHCRAHVEKALNSLPGVEARVTLDPPAAVVSGPEELLRLETLQHIVSEQAGDYRLSE